MSPKQFNEEQVKTLLKLVEPKMAKLIKTMERTFNGGSLNDVALSELLHLEEIKKILENE